MSKFIGAELIKARLDAAMNFPMHLLHGADGDDIERMWNAWQDCLSIYRRPRKHVDIAQDLHHIEDEREDSALCVQEPH